MCVCRPLVSGLVGFASGCLEFDVLCVGAADPGHVTPQGIHQRGQSTGPPLGRDLSQGTQAPLAVMHPGPSPSAKSRSDPPCHMSKFPDRTGS